MGAAALAVTVAVVVLAAASSYLVTWSLLRRNEAQRLDADAALAEQRLGQLLGEEVRAVHELAHNPLLVTALLDSEGRDQYAQPFLRTHVAHGALVALALHDCSGDVVSAVGVARPVRGAAWLAGVVDEGRAHAALDPDATGHLKVMLPVDDPDTAGAEGVLVAELDVATFVGRLTGWLPPDLSLRVVAPDGRVVASAGREAPARWGRTLQLPAPAAELGLRFEASEPEALLRPPGWLAAVYVAASAALAGIALLLSRRAAERITRPLRELESAAGRIAAEGTFRVRVPAEGHDEVARLGGAFNRMLAALEDASEADRAVLRDRQLRAERALRIALLAVEHAPDAMLVVDPCGRVQFANAAAGRFAGRPAPDLLERPLWELVPAIEEADWSRRWSEIRSAGVSVGEHALPACGAEAPRHVEVTARHLEVDGVEHGVVALRDLTEHHQAEAALRLAGVGTLAAGVAHEINNPLTYVLGNLSFVRSGMERLAAAAAPPAPPAAESAGPGELRAQADEALQALDEARQGAERVREIVRALRTFARPADRAREVVDLELAVGTAAVLARNEIRHRARLVVDARPVPRIVASRQRIEQVVLNLLVNAAQAIPEGRADANTITVRIRPGGGGAIVEVEDTGSGMTPEVRARIFEPFFTTKPVGTGTGLGLSICHGIVAELGGRIEAESAPGRGSTLRVILPAGGEPSARRAPEPLTELPRARLLVVDDEAEVGRAIRRLLPAQVEAIVETSAAAALGRVRRGEAFDAVLCDVMMPEMSGFELEAAIRAVRPELAARFVFVTGGAFTPGASERLARAPDRWVEKPVEREALHATLARALRGGWSRRRGSTHG
jgi:PAS domain S-box-containing protein